jgi:hypothetical protein
MMTGPEDPRHDDGLQRRRVHVDGTYPPVVIEEDDATARFEQLGLEVPTASVLPRNFTSAARPDDFVFEAMTSTIRTLGRRAGLTLAVPGPHAYRAIHEKDHEVVAPVIQFAHAFLIEGGAVLVVEFLKELSRHIALRWGAKATRERRVLLEIVVTHGKHARRVTYDGPREGLSSVVEVAARIFDDEDGSDR